MNKKNNPINASNANAIIDIQKITITFLLALAAGLPVALSGSTLSAWYTVEGISLKEIGLVGLAAAPYTFKFLWAPFMDRWLPPFLGRRRGWILLCQIALCLAIAGMGFMTPSSHPKLLFTIACLIAFFSASQDIAIDAYRTELLHANERPMGAAMYVNGYRIALLVSGGLALVMADHLGWQTTMILLSAIMATGIIATILGPEPDIKVIPPKSLKECVVQPFVDFLRQPGSIWILLVIVFYKMGDAFAGAMSQAFLIREIHFSLTEIGLMAKTMGFLGTILGALLGAWWMNRMGWFKALFLFGVFQMISNLIYMILLWTGPQYFVAGFATFIENLCGGMGTAAFLSLLMSLCNVRFTAFQYALLSSVSLVGRVFVGPLAGSIANDFGWNAYFYASVVLSIPGLILLLILKNRIQGFMEIQTNESLSLPSVA